jgi:hypothetical protein
MVMHKIRIRENPKGELWHKILAAHESTLSFQLAQRSRTSKRFVNAFPSTPQFALACVLDWPAHFTLHERG